MSPDLERLLQMLAQNTSGAPQEYRGPEVAPALAPSRFAAEPPLRAPEPRGGRFLDTFAASLHGLEGPRVRRGAGTGEQLLAGLLGGMAEGFSRGRLTDMAERQLFNRSQAAQTQARVKERDASFKDARGKAEAVKRDRIAQMRRAIERYQSEASSADDHARNALPGDAGQQASFVAKRDRALGEIARIEKDLARLEKREPVAGTAPAPITPRTPKAKAPAPAPKGASPTEKRRTMVAGVVSDLTTRGMGDPAGIRAYYNQQGVAAKLAEHGITLADLLRAVPK